MSEELAPDSIIHMRVPRELKGRWVALSRKNGEKLTDWIINAVEYSIRERATKTTLEESVETAGTPSTL
jgi:hypothetical protein